MPTAKGKGDSASHRYRPASEYDDATLAQKREYWRTKKREQRARLSERRGRPVQDSRGKKLLHLNAPAVVIPSFSPSFAACSPPVQSKDESLKTANVSPSQSGNSVGDSSAEATQSQKEKWLQTMKLNKVLPQSPGSCSMSAEAAEGNTAAGRSRTAAGAVSRVVTSPTAGGFQLNTTSSVPPVTVTRITNGSSAKTAPQPRVSMQGAAVPQTQPKGQVALRIQPKPLPTNVTTGMILVSPCATVSIKTEGKAANTTPQSGTKCALVTSQGPEGVGHSQPSLQSEEERAARRREHWRIKKREQRAKVAAQIAKAREMTVQRQAAQKTGFLGATILQNLSSQSALRAAGQGQCTPRVKASIPSAKRGSDELHGEAASLVTVNLQTDQIKVQNPREKRAVLTAIPSGEISVKKPGESHRRLPSYGHFSNVTRGIARCKTPRQRFIEAQKNFLTQRNIRCKAPSLASVFGTRNIPKIDPNDTPEQIIAKRREYWRIKKREQRAKLSMEVKSRLKERDSLMRRVKRYQKILEEMRRARVLTQSAGSSLTDSSETIGGFIKEDGTVSVNIPHPPTDHSSAAHKHQVELDAVHDNTPITGGQHDSKGRATAPIRVNQPTPPPPPRRPQVKVSFPLAGQLNKPRLLPIRPRTQPESTAGPNSPPLAVQTCQLTLTHPQSPRSAASGGSAADSTLGGCVMKMAVSSSAPSLSSLSLDPGLTEEERMAKKREYWRIKKREQRAACAARLRQGVLQARANVALQRRKAQRPAAGTPGPQPARLATRTGDAQPPPKNSLPLTPHADEIKQETESMPAVHLNSQAEQAICPEIKPPTPPTPPPAPQPECDPALNADSQATTLLAVASMKKLLEESLSTVMECNNEQAEIKTESTEEASEQEMKPNLPQLFFEKDEVAPMAADLTLEIKSWQSETDASVQSSPPSPHLKEPSHSGDTPPPLSASTEEVLHPTCDHSSQTSSNFIVNPFMAVSGSPPSPHRTQRLCTKTESHENACSPEPPKLHHLPTTQPPTVDKQCEQQCQAQEQCWNSSSPSAQRYRSVAGEPSGLTSLQRKREYWKLMKRQQRARLKARQKDRHAEGNSRLSHKNIQAPALVIINTVKGGSPPAKAALQPKPSIASVSVGKSIPTVLLVTPTACNAQQSPDTLQVKLPVTSVSSSPTSEPVNLNVGPSQTVCDHVGAPEHQQQAMPASHKWMSGSTDVDLAPSPPTLKPPDNPLSNINLQPIEPPIQTPSPTLSPIKIPCAQSQSPTHMVQVPPKLAPISTMVPPKLMPGESEEDFLRRKREYWRIKKKEQRARKAIRDKGVTPRRASNSWRPILPAQDPQAQDRAAQQDSGQWGNSSEDSGHLLSTSADTDPESFVYSNYTAPVEDESEFLLADYENNNGEEGPVSDTVWRNRYLMDYDPLNQLLVCMVCGEQQYSHSLEGVRAHIDETHPHTLSLDPGEQQRILEAWDEQVSQRERFFTSQLQQHSGALAETHRN